MLHAYFVKLSSISDMAGWIVSIQLLQMHASARTWSCTSRHHLRKGLADTSLPSLPLLLAEPFPSFVCKSMAVPTTLGAAWPRRS